MVLQLVTKYGYVLQICITSINEIISKNFEFSIKAVIYFLWQTYNGSDIELQTHKGEKSIVMSILQVKKLKLGGHK